MSEQNAPYTRDSSILGEECPQCLPDPVHAVCPTCGVAVVEEFDAGGAVTLVPDMRGIIREFADAVYARATAMHEATGGGSWPMARGIAFSVELAARGIVFA